MLTHACIVVTHSDDALYLRTGIVIGIVSLIIVLVFLAKVHATCELTDGNEVGPIDQLWTQRRLMQQALESLHRANVGIEAQLLAHGEQTLLWTHLSRWVIVKLRVANCREQYGICTQASLEGLLWERIANLVDGIRPTDGIFIRYLMTKLLTYSRHHIYTDLRNLRSYTITW